MRVGRGNRHPPSNGEEPLGRRIGGFLGVVAFAIPTSTGSDALNGP